MARKLLGGCALLAALTFAVGCGGSSSSSTPTKTKEQHEKEMKMMQDKMMNKDGKGAEGGTAPMGGDTVPMGTPEKK